MDLLGKHYFCYLYTCTQNGDVTTLKNNVARCRNSRTAKCQKSVRK